MKQFQKSKVDKTLDKSLKLPVKEDMKLDKKILAFKNKNKKKKTK